MGETMSSLSSTNSHHRLDSFNHDDLGTCENDIAESEFLRTSPGDKSVTAKTPDDEMKKSLKASRIKVIDPRSPTEEFTRTPVYSCTENKPGVTGVSMLESPYMSHVNDRRKEREGEGQWKSVTSGSRSEANITHAEEDGLLNTKQNVRNPLIEIKKNKMASVLFRVGSVHGSEVTQQFSGSNPSYQYSNSSHDSSVSISSSSSISSSTSAGKSQVTNSINVTRCESTRADCKSVISPVAASGSKAAAEETPPADNTADNPDGFTTADEGSGASSDGGENGRVRSRGLGRFSFRSPAILSNRYSLISGDD